MFFLKSNGDSYVYFPNSNNAKFIVEIADTPEGQSYGLMYRTELEENRGMLFIFDQERQLSFWMKNTFIPLDIIFIDSDGTINTIHENTKPKIP
jgi:uncharacterized protein